MVNPTFSEGKEEAIKEARNFTAMELCYSIVSFHADPPDTPFQRGWLQGLFDLLYTKLAQTRDNPP